MQNSVIVVAGGVGKRMGSDVPKQFHLLNGKPVIFHSIQPFLDFDPAIKLIIVLPKEHLSTWQTMCSEYLFHVEHCMVEGGETRYHSVKNGLKAVGDTGLVAVHDSVRPNINSEWVRSCFIEAEKSGNAIPCISVTESLREIDNEENKPVDRNKIRIIQTPQVFQTSILKQAYSIPHRDSFTDDASVIEAAGHKINLVYGLKENIKITHPADLHWSEWFKKNPSIFI
jgi:2-C-methyl-D-erythritol 4-phosphate cytidylyltransferase